LRISLSPCEFNHYCMVVEAVWVEAVWVEAV
jgi:hypothetical protein